MKSLFDVIVRPIITEKSTLLAEKLQYTFEVEKNATKTEIKKAVETIFGVDVVAVRTINVHRKAKRMGKYEGYKPAFKKAVVRLEKGQTIKQFEV